MSGVLERAAGFFVAPAAAGPRVEAAVVPPAVRAVVLGSRSDAVPLAAALALSLRAATRARTAVVAVWPPGEIDGDATRRGLASRGAAALAARLTARNLPAVARGRLVWLAVPLDAPAAAGAVRRASSIVDGPQVTALTETRPAELDDLVAEHDIAVVAADPETALARAALARLGERGVVASARRPPGRGLLRALALAGLAAPRVEASRLAAVVRREARPTATVRREGER